MTTRPRSTAVLFTLLCSMIVIAGLLLFGARTHAQDAQEVGNAPDGENALEFIGKIDQVGPAFTGYGYMSYISGIPDDQLFSDPANRSEATARFTFASTANLTARSVLETLFVLNAAGSTTIYYNETPNGDFADATTFSSGTPIAISSERWQNIISVQAPDTAINTGMSQFHQTTATPFTLNGSNYQLGHVDMLLRFSYTGEAKRMDRILPTSTVVVAGNAVVGSGS